MPSLQLLVQYLRSQCATRSDEGATAVEYALLVGLIAGVLTIVVAALGTKIAGIFTTVTAAI